MLLDVTGLDVRYGRIRALNDVDLGVAQGEIVAILGANGAGKTTLLRTLQGLVKPAAGRAAFDGKDITAASSRQRVRAGLALVPEGRQIFLGMTIEENLLIGMHLRRNAPVRQDLQQIYDMFSNLASRRDMPARVLSGGEQQMLAIGRALLSKPRLMMLDEPSLGLSPLYVDRLFDLIRDLNRDGLGILLVEQNTRMALDVAARAYVLERGSVVMSGDAAVLARDAGLAAAYLGTDEPSTDATVS